MGIVRGEKFLSYLKKKNPNSWVSAGPIHKQILCLFVCSYCKVLLVDLKGPSG